jgi:acyl carrier protein
MNRDDIRRAMLESLASVAPEADPSSIRPDTDLREELDIDSMDFLRYVTALHRALGVDVPEADYPKLFTLQGGEAYLAAALAVRDG